MIHKADGRKLIAEIYPIVERYEECVGISANSSDGDGVSQIIRGIKNGTYSFPMTPVLLFALTRVRMR